MYRIDIRDILGGGALIAFGTMSAFMSAGYGIGTIRNIGAGFFPLVLSALLIFFGLTILVPAFLRAGERIEVQWRNVAVVTVAIVFFGAALKTIGLLPSIVATVLIVSLASALTLRQSIITGVVMAALIWLVFILGLGMTVPLTPWSY